MLKIFCFFLFLFHSGNSVFNYKKTLHGLEITLDQRLIFKHSELVSVLRVGRGQEKYLNDLGNFVISEKLEQKVELKEYRVKDEVDGNGDILRFQVQFSAKDEPQLQVSLLFEDDKIKVLNACKLCNRLWIKMHAEKEEHLYGGGEQFTHFSLRGFTYPMWGREQGVGRNKSTLITYLAEKIAGAGGDYHTTYWPQPTFVSDRLFYAHLDFNFYSLLNFTPKDFHEIELWGDFSSATITMGTAPSWPGLMTKLTRVLGRQMTPPKWLYRGAVIGLQGGTDVVMSQYNNMTSQGVRVSALWIQDWSGKIMTSLGKRVFWGWEWDSTMYPGLDVLVKTLKERDGVRFLSYINPHIIKGSKMFEFANQNLFFIKSKSTGTTQIVDFGEMECGTVDLSNPQAYEWYKGVLKDMIKFGFGGWMADFGGEYLPVDDTLYYNNQPSTSMHNEYNFLWAKLNHEAVVEYKRDFGGDEIFIFMRSGFGRSSGYTLMSWGGDQNVDFSYSDGLASVIPAALSLGMSGMGLHHSDVGGYVSLICMVRTEELLLRWAEMNLFSPVLRTHEGNRPYRNLQINTTPKITKSFARITMLFNKLSTYHEFVANDNHLHGYPAQRPLFFHYPKDNVAYDVKYQYIYGPDLLVAPVLFEGCSDWSVYLPRDSWIYLWNGTEIESDGENVIVTSQIGNPPVFYRKTSNWKNLFKEFQKYEVKEPDLEGLSWNLFWNNPFIFWFLLLRKLFWHVFFNV